MSLLDSLPSSLSGLLVYSTTFVISISTDGKNFIDITKSLPPMNMISIHYTDPISFEADTLDIMFPDIGDKIINSKQIKKGVWLNVKINQMNRDYPGSHVQRDLGSFMIDQLKQIGPPSQTTIMASSIPISSQVKYTLQNKTRFTQSIRVLGKTVADENGFHYVCDVPELGKADKPLTSVAQWNETDLAMLSRECKEKGLAMNMKNGTLTIFDEQAYEAKPAKYTIDFSQPAAGIGMVRWELTTQSQDIYSTTQLAWYDPDTGQYTVGQAKAGNDTGSGDQHNVYDQPDTPPTATGDTVGGGD